MYFMKLKLNKVLGKVFNKVVKTSVSNVVQSPDEKPVVVPDGNSKEKLWKFILQTLISILTAVLTALGATSCMGIN